MTMVLEDRASRIAQLGYDFVGQPKQAVDRCNLCGTDRFVILVHRDRYGYPAQASGCLRCGLVVLNPVMTSAAYMQFYTDVYRPLVSAYHGRLIDAVTIQAEQRDYAVERAELLTPYLGSRSSARLLDIGGSTGVVSAHFVREFGLHATVLDPSPDELRQAQRFGLETIAGLLEEFDPGADKYDVVIMCQTVDHLLDVGASIRKVRQLLREDGLFYVDAVDLRAAYLRNHSMEEAIKIDHPYYLTEATMTAYLRQAGFDILRMDYAADHLHVGFICRPSTPQPEYLPDQSVVDTQWREIRWVQNAPRSAKS